MSTEFRSLQDFSEDGQQCEYVTESTRNKRCNLCHYYENNRGYEYIKHDYQDSVDYVPVHRLIAVAEFGIEAVEGKHVHHKNSVSWDNRPSNITTVSNSGHQKTHNTLTHRLQHASDATIAAALEKAGYISAAEDIR